MSQRKFQAPAVATVKRAGATSVASSPDLAAPVRIGSTVIIRTSLRSSSWSTAGSARRPSCPGSSDGKRDRLCSTIGPHHVVRSAFSGRSPPGVARLVAFGVVVLLTPRSAGDGRLLGVVDSRNDGGSTGIPIRRLGGLTNRPRDPRPSLAFSRSLGEMRRDRSPVPPWRASSARSAASRPRPVAKLAGQVAAASVPFAFGVGSTTSRSRSSASSICRRGSGCRSPSSGSSR